MLIERLETLLELERYDDAVKLCIENLYSDHEATEVLYSGLVLALLYSEKYTDAQRYVKEAIGLYPSESHFYFLYAQILTHGFGSLKNAEDNIKQALEINPHDADYYAFYAEIYMQLKKFRQAKEMIDKALEIDASDLDYHLTLASIFWFFDGTKIAKEIVNDVLAKDPHNERALYIKSELFSTIASKRGDILKDLLSRNPTQKHYQNDLKFVKFYYRFIPACMTLMLLFSLLLHMNRSTFGPLEAILPFAYFILMMLGSNDWRFNIPFIGLMLGINTYFTSIPNGIEPIDIIFIPLMALILNYVMYGFFTLFERIALKFINTKKNA